MKTVIAEIGPRLEFVDVEDKDIKQLKIGHYVEVTLCGYVSKLSGPGDYSGQSSIGLKVTKREVRKVGNSQSEGFRKLSKDDDEDDEEIEEEYKK